MIDEMFNTVGQAVGVHVILLVVEHSLWKTKHKYEDAERIHFSAEGIVLDDLSQLEPEKAQAIAEEFITMFVAALGRLVGKQMALQLTQQLNEDSASDMEG
ncbi:MAG TPA: hypothetical protein VN426_04390 [Syntrophomonadaceae bacterium]|nr:hypothetical protein [Syntrophomonadaceae bacterium]